MVGVIYFLVTTPNTPPPQTSVHDYYHTYLRVDLLCVVEVVDEGFGHHLCAFAGARAAAACCATAQTRGGAGGFSSGLGGAPRHVYCRSHVVVEGLAWARARPRFGPTRGGRGGGSRRRFLLLFLGGTLGV